MTKLIKASPTFSDVVYARRSARSFLQTPVLHETIVEALQEAQQAPSNCNTQPWIVHVVSGAKLQELSGAMLLAEAQGRRTFDFPFDRAAYKGQYWERNDQQARTYFASLGVERGDEEGRKASYLRNFSFFGAPHVALLFMPEPADVRVAADIGMFAQTFLLALTSRNLEAIPQTSLSYFADTVRDVLNIPSEQKLLFGISFGHADENYPGYGFDLGRAALSEDVTFHD